MATTVVRHMTLELLDDTGAPQDVWWSGTVQFKGDADEIVLVDQDGQRRWKGMQQAFIRRVTVAADDQPATVTIELDDDTRRFAVDASSLATIQQALTPRPPPKVWAPSIHRDLAGLFLVCGGLVLLMLDMAILFGHWEADALNLTMILRIIGIAVLGIILVAFGLRVLGPS